MYLDVGGLYCTPRQPHNPVSERSLIPSTNGCSSPVTHPDSSSSPGRLRADETGQTSAVGVQAVAVGLVYGTTRIDGDLHAHVLVGQAGQRQREGGDNIEKVAHPEAAVYQQVERHHEVVQSGARATEGRQFRFRDN